MFYNIEPFGEFRSELRHGQSMAMTANMNRDTKAKPEPFEAFDFMSFVEKPKERELTPEEVEALLDKMFR